MITRIDTAPFAVLVKGAAELTTSFAGNDSVHSMYGLDHTDGAGHSCGPAIAQANEVALILYKTQGTADKILIQVQESDTLAFTIPVVVPIAGAEYYTVTSTISDTTYYRLPLVPIRARYFRVLAKYSGGAATTAEVTVLAMRFSADVESANAVAISGAGTSLAADVKKIDRIADEGLCYSAAIAVSNGTWLSNVVTFTTTGHAWVAGDYITVSGCGNTSYNGSYTVVSAATNTWTAALVGDPGAFTTAGSAVQAQSTTRLVDETKSWTADEWSTAGCYVEITSGTGARQYKLITDNGTHWLAFAAMTTAPVTSDSSYAIVELNVNALVCDTELAVKISDITIDNIDAYKYRSTEPDLAAGESAQGSCDVKGNVRVAGAEAHSAVCYRAPVLTGGYAKDAAPTDVSDADVVNAWHAQNGAAVVAGYNQDASGTVATALEVGTDNAASVGTPTPLRVGGIVRTSGADYTTLDTCTLSFDLKGNARVGGATPSGEGAIGNPLLGGGKASAALPTAVDANDSIATWLTLSGATVSAGRNQDASGDVSTCLEVGTDNAASVGTPTPLRVGGICRTSGADYTTLDTCTLSFDLKGGVRVAGGTPSGEGVVGNPLLDGGKASSAAPSAVDAGDSIANWLTLNGATVIAGRNQDGAASDVATALDVGTDNAAATTAGLLRVGGIARAGGAAYSEGDSALISTDLVGNLRVGGSVAHDVAATGNPLLMGAYASDVIQTAAAAAGRSVHLWSSLNGALCTAGLYQHATPASAVSLTMPVVKDHAIFFQTNATLLPIGAMYLASAPTYDNQDAAALQVNVHGALITTGGVGEGDIAHGQETLAAAGTEQAIATSQAVTDGMKVSVKAMHTNTSAVYIGDSNTSSSDGFVLYPGEGISLAVNNTNLIYFDGDTTGDKISWIVEV